MRKTVCTLIVVILLFAVQVSPAFAQEKAPEIHGLSGIVIDAQSGKVLYEKDVNTKREPASTTKIMTCLLALEHLDLDQVITVSGRLEDLGTVLKLKPGEKMTVEELLYGLMLHSANDAALVLAREVGGSIKGFSTMMNERAIECGAKNTNFTNPNGLNREGEEKHLTTAYDLAMIAKEAMKNKTFRKLVSTAKYTIAATNKSGPRKLTSTNLCLWDTKDKIKVNGKKTTPKYEGVIGIKTGLTSPAGHCFVGGVNRNGSELISVVLHSGELTRFADSIELWEYAFDQHYTTYKTIKSGQKIEKVRTKHGAVRSVMAVAREDAFVTLTKEESTDGISAKFHAKETTAPVKKGQVIGTIDVYNGAKLVNSAEAVAAESVPTGGPLSYIGIPDVMGAVILIAVTLLLLFIIMIRLSGARNRARRRVRRKRRAGR